MAIRPVSGVGFRDYNNIMFESRRNRENRYSSSSTVPIKAIPLAVLLAMSPMKNCGDVFAVEPNNPKTEVLTGSNLTQQNQFVPLPSNFKVLKDVHVDFSSGGYTGFKLTDTDQDDSNFEIVEFTDVGATGRVIERGILKAVSIRPSGDGRYDINLYGISLSKTDLNNYAPQKAIMRVLYPKAKDLHKIYRGLIDSRDNNTAVIEIPSNADYREFYYYPADLQIYKKKLGFER